MKLSLVKILEDIDLKKVKLNKHPFLKDIIESPVIGLYAWLQAYNKLVYKGVIDGPTLNINQINTPETKVEQPGNLSFSKNSFKTDINPEAKRISLFGREGTEHDVIHLITTNLAKNFARKRKSLGNQSRFNKKMHFKARKTTPKEKTGPNPDAFGTSDFSDLGQYAWEELLGNVLNDTVRSSISTSGYLDPKRTAMSVYARMKRAYTDKDSESQYDIGGIPQPFRDKILKTAATVIHKMVQEYNKFVRIYKHSAMKQQGEKEVSPIYAKRTYELPDDVRDMEWDD